MLRLTRKNTRVELPGVQQRAPGLSDRRTAPARVSTLEQAHVLQVTNQHFSPSQGRCVAFVTATSRGGGRPRFRSGSFQRGRQPFQIDGRLPGSPGRSPGRRAAHASIGRHEDHGVQGPGPTVQPSRPGMFTSRTTGPASVQPPVARPLAGIWWPRAPPAVNSKGPAGWLLSSRGPAAHRRRSMLYAVWFVAGPPRSPPFRSVREIFKGEAFGP